MKVLILDGRLMTSKEALYLHLNRVLALPNHFGNNLDALWDVLNEGTEPTEILFSNTDLAQKQLGDYGVKLVNLFERLAQQNNCYMVSFQS